MSEFCCVHCWASVSEFCCVFIGSMVVMYIMHVCNVYMHNAQYNIYTKAAWVECLALSLSAASLFLSCLRSAVSAARQALSLVPVCTVACFPCLAMVPELFWKYSDYTSLQATKQL